jgi:hypothetical protein
MKNIAFIIFMFLCSATLKGQNDSLQTVVKNNELKINVTNLVVFAWADIAYERIINEESSVGTSVLVSFNNDNDIDLREYRNFSVTSYYRRFFSRKHAQGFFVEGFAMLNSAKNDYFFDSLGNERLDEKNYTDLAFGVSAGAKFLTKRGFAAEVYLGIGRNLFDGNSLEIVGRGGISLGYRF